MAFTTTTANKILNKILRNTDFVAPTAVYVSLHTADPGETGANEISGGSYVRKQVTFSAAASKVTANTADLEWADMPAATLTHIGLWDASSAGSYWWGGPLTESKVVAAGDTFRISTSDLDVALT